MPEPTARLRRLRRLPSAQQDAALRAVLPHALGDELERFAAEALERAGRSKPARSSVLLISVLRTWPKLSGEAQAATIAVAGDRIADLLGELERSEDRLDRRVAAEVGSALVTGATGRLPEGLPELLLMLHRLTSDSLAVAHAAMLGLAGALDSVGPAHGNALAILDAAVAECAGRYEEHRCTELLRAISSRAADAGPKVREWLAGSSEAGHLALRSINKKMAPEEARDQTVRALGVPALVPASIARLESLDAEEDRAAALAQSHLLERRSRAASVGRLRKLDSLMGGAWPEGQPVESRRGAIRWIQAAPLTPVQRVERYAGALYDPDPGVRLLAVLALRRCPASPAADATLRDFAFDADERVAHAALSTFATAPSKRRRESASDVFAALSRSQHPRVRRMAAQALALVTPVEVKAEDLRRDLGSADPAVVLAGLDLVVRRGLTHTLSEQLVRLTDHADPFVAAQAVSALSRVPGEAVRDALLAALGHPDGRVVANAVEAVGRREHEGVRLGAFISSAVPRVRANAIRWAIREGKDAGAQGELTAMLADARPEHRLSALWVAERTAQTELAGRVAQLLREDDDERVRVRAERAARVLLASMKSDWAVPTRSTTAGVTA